MESTGAALDWLRLGAIETRYSWPYRHDIIKSFILSKFIITIATRNKRSASNWPFSLARGHAEGVGYVATMYFMVVMNGVFMRRS